MPLAGGIFTRIFSWKDDRANGIEISDVRFDDEMDGMAEALNKTLYRDGQAAATGNISMGNNRLTNLADPQSDTDAMNQRSADTRYGTSTAVRLSLVSGVAVPESDISGAGTVYLLPDGSNTIGLWSGSAWVARQFAETSLALDAAGHLANKNYDVFAFWDGSQVRIGSAPAWAGNVQRGVGNETSELEAYQGRLVNKNTVTLRNGGSNITTLPARRGLLVGGFRVGSIAGQTEDSAQRRFLSNIYGRTIRPMFRADPAASWTYNVNTWRQAHALAANQVEWFSVAGGDPIAIEVFATASNDSATKLNAAVGIGIDQVAVNDAPFTRALSVDNYFGPLSAKYEGFPGIGYHYAAWLEISGASGVRTFWGKGGTGSGSYASGIAGRVVA